MRTVLPILVASGYFISFTSGQVYEPVNPDDFDINIRDAWCTDQTAACEALCQDQEQVPAVVNDCDAETLQWNCLCENNKTPNMTEYSMTIDYHLCQQSITKCASDCSGESSCADLCFTGRKCGATNPTLHNTTTTSSSPSPSKTPSGDGDGDDDDNEGDDIGDDPFAEEDDKSGLAARSSAAFGLVVIAAVAGMGFLGLL